MPPDNLTLARHSGQETWAPETNGHSLEASFEAAPAEGVRTGEHTRVGEIFAADRTFSEAPWVSISGSHDPSTLKCAVVSKNDFDLLHRFPVRILPTLWVGKVVLAICRGSNTCVVMEVSDAGSSLQQR